MMMTITETRTTTRRTAAMAMIVSKNTDGQLPPSPLPTATTKMTTLSTPSPFTSSSPCQKTNKRQQTMMGMAPKRTMSKDGGVKGRSSTISLITASKMVMILISVMMTVGVRGADQRFALEPQDRTAIVGETIIMACRVVNKKGNLQWSRDGFGLGTDRELKGYPRYTMTGNDDEGDYSLQIRNVQLEDDSTFQCQVGASDGYKPIISREAQLTVYVPPEPPKIVNGDVISTIAGNEVELTCESVGGKPAAELTWLDGENNVANVGNVLASKTPMNAESKRENSALKWTFNPTKDDDGKIFTCRSENQALKMPAKAFVKMEVKYQPEVEITLDKEHVTEGDELSFTCNAVANPAENLVYKWFKNHEIINGDHGNKLTIKKVTSEWDGVNVTCEVSNMIGTGKYVHKFKIDRGPFFRRPLGESYGVTIGEELRLTCDIAGSPRPEITWLKEKEDRVVSKKETLIIPIMTYDSAGRYTCRASVPGFPELTANTLVFIKGPPSLSKTAPIQVGNLDDTVTIECMIQSVTPPSKISWTRYNSQVGVQSIETDNDLGFQLVESREEDDDSIIKNLLVIPRMKKEDFTTYNCSADNEHGTSFVTITVKEQKQFPSVMISGSIIGAVVLVVFVTIAIVLCLKRSNGLDGSDQGLHDKTKSGSVMDSNSEAGHHGHGHSNHTHPGIHHEWKVSAGNGASSASERDSSSSDTCSSSAVKILPPNANNMSSTYPYHYGPASMVDANNYHNLYDNYNVIGGHLVGGQQYVDNNLVSSYYGNLNVGGVGHNLSSTLAKDVSDNVTYTNLYDTRYNMICDLTPGSSTIVNHTLTGIVNPIINHSPSSALDPSASPSAAQFVGAGVVGVSGSNWKPYNGGTSTLV